MYRTIKKPGKDPKYQYLYRNEQTGTYRNEKGGYIWDASGHTDRPGVNPLDMDTLEKCGLDSRACTIWLPCRPDGTLKSDPPRLD